MHVASGSAACEPRAANEPRATPRNLGIAGAAVAAAVVLALAVAVALRPHPSSPSKGDVVTDDAPAPDAEAERLLRSAFATLRRPG